MGRSCLHPCFLFPHHHFLFIRINFSLFIHHLLFLSFFVENPTGPKLVFGEKRGVQRNLVPVCQGPAAFDTKVRVHRFMIKVLNLIFDRNAETIRQTDFYFLGEKVIHWPFEETRPLDKSGQRTLPKAGRT